MRSNLTALIAAGLLSAGCASTPPLMPPTLPPPIPPSECAAACPDLPRLSDDSEAAIIIWIHEVIDVAGACRRQHDACRRSIPGIR